MSIDLDKHRDSIVKAFNDVVSDKKPEDWALFGYEGQTNTLKVIGTGEDGLEELADDLNSSKIMYAVVKVIDPNTTRHKIVLINWQGEGAPTVRKGTCARHLHDVRRLLQGVHVTVNARVEEEVEPEVVMAAVLKASASCYNFSERSETGDRTAPVSGLVNTFIQGEAERAMGTNYRRTNPLAEIDSRSRNKFWEQQEEEEKRRKQEEQQRKEEELRILEKERKQREILEAQHREQLTKERNSRILAGRRAEEEADRHVSANQQQWQEQSASEQQAEEDERSRRAEVMRQQRKKEAEALIGGRTHAARDLFEQQTTATTAAAATNRPPPRRLKEFNPVNNVREDLQDTPQQQQQQQQHSGPSRGVTARWPPAGASPSPTQQMSTPSPAQRRTTTAAATAHHTPVQDMIPPQSSPPGPPSKQPPTESPQTAHPNGLHQSELRNGMASPTRQNGSTYHHHHHQTTTTTTTTATTAAMGEAVSVIDESAGMVYEVDGVEYQILPEHGLCARALYDYQAADDTEITFDPSEIITNIDRIDEGWWQGVGPDGMYGLFPANYVELINEGRGGGGGGGGGGV
ncbi:LOW QUALITY PROTEIN: drebrin-like protein B [Portunus trituberculatus]|uniref:LOW QUALITY PROTEIN: drebrin-like protein B n=1 Tax=Portunus trituberculatus TaxID=210409 RepID=UPI001E1D1B25|nr:LOW QUALITY PROTEIN: drebrin-like protein B [Portunus trituberculatus]